MSQVPSRIGKLTLPQLFPDGASTSICCVQLVDAFGRSIIAYARPPKELWVVPDAKHNQAPHVAGDEYRRRVVAFFDRHLGSQV